MGHVGSHRTKQRTFGKTKKRFVKADGKKKPQKIEKLKKKLVPGSVVILLTGRYRGKRVVFLKQMEKSGTLLCTGPFKVNGVPLKRVSQCFTIATSKVIDLNGADFSKINDDTFKQKKVLKKAGGPFSNKGGFWDIPKKEGVTEERKKLTEAVDKPIIKKLPKLEKEYL